MFCLQEGEMRDGDRLLIFLKKKMARRQPLQLLNKLNALKIKIFGKTTLICVVLYFNTIK